jgi:hypothetical protein
VRHKEEHLEGAEQYECLRKWAQLPGFCASEGSECRGQALKRFCNQQVIQLH